MHITMYNLISEPRPAGRVKVSDLLNSEFMRNVDHTDNYGWFSEDSWISDNANARMEISLGRQHDFTDNNIYLDA